LGSPFEKTPKAGEMAQWLREREREGEREREREVFITGQTHPSILLFPII
jgi:hypothetical protein